MRRLGLCFLDGGIRRALGVITRRPGLTCLTLRLLQCLRLLQDNLVRDTLLVNYQELTIKYAGSETVAGQPQRFRIRQPRTRAWQRQRSRDCLTRPTPAEEWRGRSLCSQGLWTASAPQSSSCNSSAPAGYGGAARLEAPHECGARALTTRCQPPCR